MRVNYKEVIASLDKRGIEVVAVGCRDAQSGWTGEHLYLKNKEGYLNTDGTYTTAPKSQTLDFSGNGYCFRESTVIEVMEQLDQFFLLKDMKDFDSFEKYIRTKIER